MKTAALLILFATPALAQDYAMRAGDTVPTAAGLNDMILDRDLEYFDGGVSRYGADGSYAWTYAENNGGGVWAGTYILNDDMALCVTFETGQERCDKFVISNDRLVLLTSEGQRFPLRTIHQDSTSD